MKVTQGVCSFMHVVILRGAANTLFYKVALSKNNDDAFSSLIVRVKYCSWFQY